MHVSATNDNDLPGKRKGSILRQGRLWFYRSGYKTIFNIEWSFWGKGRFSNWFDLTLDLATGESSALLFHVGIWRFFSIFLGFYHDGLRERLERLTIRKDEKYSNGRSIGISAYGPYIWINFWNDPHQWRSVDPWWHRISIDVPRLLFGRLNYDDRTISNHRVEIPMPEHTYGADVKIVERIRKRKRWPFAKHSVGAEITPDIPIPVPGKGENSWDCGEDATHSLTCAASTPLAACVAMFESVMRKRMNYGGPTWRPAAHRKEAS